MQDMWNQRFSAEEYYYGKAPNPYFKDRIGQLPPGSILMPAEGEGRNGVYAARLGWNVIAVDFSEAGRKKALELAKENNVTLEYLLADIAAFDFGKEQYDAVGMIYVHMPPAVRPLVHQNLIRSLKPGGYFILEAFNKKQLRNSSGGPQSPDMLFDMNILREDFKGLATLELDEYVVHLEAGDGHSGEADIIRYFGRK